MTGSYNVELKIYYYGEFQGYLKRNYINVTGGNYIDKDIIQNSDLEIQNYPNPFKPETTILFSLPDDSEVELNIYNIKGQKARIIIAEEMIKGKHSVVWSGDDDRGRKVSSGIYFYQFAVNGKVKKVRMCLLLK